MNKIITFLIGIVLTILGLGAILNFNSIGVILFPIGCIIISYLIHEDY